MFCRTCMQNLIKMFDEKKKNGAKQAHAIKFRPCGCSSLFISLPLLCCGNNSFDYN